MITIKDKSNCTGCSACYSACPVKAITMIRDEQGFLYPKVGETCIECGKCENVCPIINPVEEKKFEQKAYLLQHKDPIVLRDSSSGGAFTAIATAVIQKGGVVFGAAYDSDFSVHHKYVDTVEALAVFRNSKYVQSTIGNAYIEVKRFVDAGRDVCFSGTPCQIEGLINYLGKKPKSLILIDIVCHAVPSPAVWNAYLDILKERGINNIKNLRFRDKDKYGYLYSQFAIETEGKKIFQGIETNEMLRAFFSEICNRPSCYKCQFKKQYRRSDITIWDCFDIDEFTNSSIFDQSKGISRVLVHTPEGIKLVDQSAECCLIEEISVEKALHYDAKEMLQSVEKNKKYEAFWEVFMIDPQKAILMYFPQEFKNSFESIIRQISMKIGIYHLLRKVYKRVLGNRQR